MPHGVDNPYREQCGCEECLPNLEEAVELTREQRAKWREVTEQRLLDTDEDDPTFGHLENEIRLLDTIDALQARLNWANDNVEFARATATSDALFIAANHLETRGRTEYHPNHPMFIFLHALAQDLRTALIPASARLDAEQRELKVREEECNWCANEVDTGDPSKIGPRIYAYRADIERIKKEREALK